MGKIVKVVVDLALENLNQEYDYLLPETLESKIKLGQLVKVPFGNRKIKAFVTGIDVKTELKRSQLKKIDSLVYEQSFFDQKLLDLFKWIANYYHSFLAQVIKSALPAGITDKKIKKKKIKYLALNNKLEIKKELANLDNRATKQKLILEYLLKNQDKKIELKKVLTAAETSKNTVKRLIDKNLVILYNKVVERKPELEDEFKVEKKINYTLNNYENNLLNQILNSKNQNRNFLLESKNNSKRYYFIIKILENLLDKNKNVIILIPEIKKDYMFLKQLKNNFQTEIAFLHSRLSKGEFFDEWQQIKKGKIKLVVGARSAIFAPFSEVDAVIIMEENNNNYKQQEHPLFHVRQIAAKRLHKKNSLLILESPLPSVESRYMAEKNHYQKIALKAEPCLVNNKIIDMRKEVENGNLDDLSNFLKKEIKAELKKNNKIMLFLNRKGTANYVICRKCGELLKCENCNISLNYYEKNQKLRCHYCGFEKRMPQKCPNCGSSFISPAGIGTEKLIKEVKKIYPTANSAKLDNSLKEEKITEILKKFKAGEINILIATSIIIRNQFYKNLNFLGVISADTALNSSDFRTAENHYFLLNQLRNLINNLSESKILLQSYQPEHYSLRAFIDNDNFYKKELKLRKDRNYPPFCRLLNIIISSNKEAKAAKTAKKLDQFLNEYSHKIIDKTIAAPAALNKIRNKFRWQIILKFETIRKREYVIQLIEKLFSTDFENESVEIRIDVDPYQML